MKYHNSDSNRVTIPKNIPTPVRGFVHGPMSVLPKSENKVRTVKSSRSDYGSTVAKNKKRTY